VGASPLDHILRHNTWATGALVEFCRTLDAAKLDANALGTYGTLSGTVQHLVGAEQWYANLLTGETVGRTVRRTDAPYSLEELATISAATGARPLRVAASDDPTRVIVTNEPRRSAVGVVLAQVVHHGNAPHAGDDHPRRERHRAPSLERMGLRPRDAHLDRGGVEMAPMQPADYEKLGRCYLGMRVK
jgi:uncharacterized damage-inducible protein DinB